MPNLSSALAPPQKSLMASSARIDELRKKFEENPRRYFAPLANEYRKAGEIDQAIAICREYLPQQPGHMSGHIVFGQALYEARQFDESKAVFETALTLDPENLIALRHLGDIALIIGDSEAAKVWYRRVLEADPRNEEIQAQLATIEQAGAAPAAPQPPPAVPAGAPSLAAPTVVMAAVPRPGAAASPTKEEPARRPAPVTAESPTAEIRLDTIPTHAAPPTEPPVEMAMGFEPTSAGLSADTLPPSPAMEIDDPVSSNKEAPPLDSFSLAGLETTSFGSPPAAQAASQPTMPDLELSLPAAPPPPPAPPVAVLPDLDFSAPAAPAAAPAAAAAPEALPDLDLGELGMPPQAAAADLVFIQPPAPAPPPQGASSDDELPLLDLGALPGMAAAPAPGVAPPATAFEPPDLAEEVASAPDAGPFVTETMAELYLQQGHREEALRVYRALLEQRAGDVSLASKVAALETELHPSPTRHAPPAAPAARPVPSAALVPAGPTMRELLYAVATRRPGVRPEPPQGNGAAPSPGTPGAMSADSDRLGDLFGNAPVSAEDEAAAQALAFAFSSNGHSGSTDAVSGISGAPAHRAANDLSLDTVFGGSATPQTPPPSNFSFDQFFSQRATSEHETSGGTDQAPAGAGDDVGKFTQWLEGLKQK